MGGPLTYEEINDIYVKYPKYRELLKVFIETGTYKGNTSRMASKYFDQVYTFEIMKDLYEESIRKGEEEGCKNITYILGDSVSGLSTLLSVVKQSSLYFIDAHISGVDSGYNGKQYVPLLEEINSILKCNKEPSIFIIDDARFWMGESERPWDWAHINLNVVLGLFKEVSILDHYLCNDRYIIITQ